MSETIVTTDPMMLRFNQRTIEAAQFCTSRAHHHMVAAVKLLGEMARREEGLARAGAPSQEITAQETLDRLRPGFDALEALRRLSIARGVEFEESAERAMKESAKQTIDQKRLKAR